MGNSVFSIRNYLKNRTREKTTSLVIVIGLIFILGTFGIGYQAYVESQNILLKSVYNSNMDLARTFRDYASTIHKNQSDNVVYQELTNIWKRIDRPFPGGYLCVFDKKGILKLHTKAPNFVGEDIGDGSIIKIKPDDPGNLRQLANMEKDWIGPYISLSGQEQITAFSFIPDLNSVVSVHVPVGDVHSHIRRTTLPWIVSLIVIGGVLLPTLMFFLHRAYLQANRKVYQMNEKLKVEVREREIAQHQLKDLNELLEQRVQQRTQELSDAQNELIRKERLATLGQITATVSHELRNPLAAMRPSLYVINKKMDNQDDRVRQAINRVDRNITRCDQIIEDLLDFTKMPKTKLKCRDLDTWLRSVLDELMVPEQIELKVNLGLNGIMVQFDSERLRRAVVNVVDNACHALLENKNEAINNEKGQIEVTTCMNAEKVEICITDNGIGMTQEVKNKMFEPLYSTKGFGIGLGMPTVKQIMEQNFGGVSVASEPSLGAKITLWLPYEKSICETA